MNPLMMELIRMKLGLADLNIGNLLDRLTVINGSHHKIRIRPRATLFSSPREQDLRNKEVSRTVYSGRDYEKPVGAGYKKVS